LESYFKMKCLFRYEFENFKFNIQTLKKLS